MRDFRAAHAVRWLALVAVLLGSREVVARKVPDACWLRDRQRASGNPRDLVLLAAFETSVIRCN